MLALKKIKTHGKYNSILMVWFNYNGAMACEACLQSTMGKKMW